MAKQKTSWDLIGSNLIGTMPYGTKAEFDLSRLFPQFEEFDESQQLSIAYGIKQKVADATARPADQKLTEDEAKTVMEATYDRIVGGQWNATKEGAITMKKKVDQAINNATPEQLEVLKQLGLA